MGCSLNEISCFPFENYMQTLKRHVRNSNNPVAQVVKRQTEIDRTWHVKRSCKSCTVSVRFGDSCFLLKDKNLCLIKEKSDNDKYVCEIIKPTLVNSFFEKPLDSKELDVMFIKNIDQIRKVIRTISISELHKKVVILPYKSGYVCYSLLHEIESKC